MEYQSPIILGENGDVIMGIVQLMDDFMLERCQCQMQHLEGLTAPHGAFIGNIHLVAVAVGIGPHRMVPFFPIRR